LNQSKPQQQFDSWSPSETQLHLLDKSFTPIFPSSSSINSSSPLSYFYLCINYVVTETIMQLKIGLILLLRVLQIKVPILFFKVRNWDASISSSFDAKLSF